MPDLPTPPGAQTSPRRSHPSIEYQLKRLLSHRPRSVSYETHRKRGTILLQFLRDLKTGGYLLQQLSNLKPKHILARVQAWKDQGLESGTIKTRMSAVRWLCEKIQKQGIVPSNDELGIPKRIAVTNTSKAWPVELRDPIFAEVLRLSPRLHLQMRLMESFGLRFEEAALLRPHESDLEYHLHVVRGTKGRRPRVVPIEDDAQRALLDEAKAQVGRRDSMVPRYFTFDRWRGKAKAIARKLGMSKQNNTHFHGLRHAWAHRTYEALSGMSPPCAAGADDRPVMMADARARDQDARMRVSEGLGHGRIQVSSIYLGSPLR